MNDLDQAQRERIRRLVAQAPPLTDAQRRRIAFLLNPPPIHVLENLAIPAQRAAR